VSEGHSYSRRDFLSAMVGTGMMLSMDELYRDGLEKGSVMNSKVKFYIFSKQLQWCDFRAMAQTAADCGFDGIDLTVRPGGHVLPERVEEDLPRAVDEVQKVGLEVPLITTAISSAADPLTEKILRTASKLGIRFYRSNWLEYSASNSIESELSRHAKELKDLATLNAQYRIRGSYQNHAGKGVGAPVWDLWLILKEVNSEWMGCQYDIRHAMVEGANCWSLGLQLVRPFVNTIVIKDFGWFREGDRWRERSVPLGEGMVDFKQYLHVLNRDLTSMPVSIHLEYPLGGADQGARSLTVSRETVMEAMKRDLHFARKTLG
jgi:sugar phosphate isomerase/epimerase